MIESSFLSSSFWESDSLPDFGAFPTPFDLEELSCELDDERFKLSGSSSPVDICSSSSCDLFLDELDKILPISDTFLSQILEDHNATAGFSDLDWTYSDSPKQYSPSLNEATNSVCEKEFKIDPFEWILTAKLWSKMTPEEQVTTLHAVAEIVTYQLPIRQQIEIIKLLDPTAVISPDDREFALDSTSFNDSKLTKIKECVKKHRCKDLEDPPHRSFPSLENAKKNSSTKINNINYSRTKRKQKKQKVTVKAPEKKKRLKQSRKEIKSSFFAYEKKMKLKHINPSEDEEDVNILE